MPTAWLGKGPTVQALLQRCRHELKHQARLPEDIAAMINLTWPTDDGVKVGRLLADQIRVIVDCNRSHFAYVTLHKRLPDGQELPMLCVSVTMKGVSMHPTYDQSGRPSSASGNSGTHDRDHHRSRHHRALDSGGFPMLSVPEVLPKLGHSLKLRNSCRTPHHCDGSALSCLCVAMGADYNSVDLLPHPLLVGT